VLYARRTNINKTVSTIRYEDRTEAVEAIREKEEHARNRRLSALPALLIALVTVASLHGSLGFCRRSAVCARPTSSISLNCPLFVRFAY